MRFIQHPLCNDVLEPPKGVPNDVCRPLPVLRGVDVHGPCIQSFWMPDEFELAAMKNGHAVLLSFQGQTHSPVQVMVAAEKPLPQPELNSAEKCDALTNTLWDCVTGLNVGLVIGACLNIIERAARQCTPEVRAKIASHLPDVARRIQST